MNSLTFYSHERIIKELINSDLFIFASSCENLPNTLLEAMASSIPIISSSKGPMREILEKSLFILILQKLIQYTVLDEIMNKKCIDYLCSSAKIDLKNTWSRCSKKLGNC